MTAFVLVAGLVESRAMMTMVNNRTTKESVVAAAVGRRYWVEVAQETDSDTMDRMMPWVVEVRFDLAIANH